MIFVLLPAYNEERNIIAIIDEIKQVFDKRKDVYSVVVVNDGSEDETLKVLKFVDDEIQLKVISFDKNLGVDAVFRSGIEYIAEHSEDEDIMISMDCDRTHRPETFNLLIESLEKGNDISIASRYQKDSTTVKLPLLRSFLSDGINVMLRLIFPINGAKDYTTFFRAYRMSVLKKALKVYKSNFITQKGFPCMAEILIKLKTFKVKVKEVPIDLRFDQRTGKSKMKIAQTILGYLVLIGKELKSRFKCVFREQDI